MRSRTKAPSARLTGLRARKKQETRRLILKSAQSLFRKKGFTATTLEDVAAKAGVHKQTVLRYFTSKEQIALAFRQIALRNFEKGLLDPARKLSVLEYWRDFIAASATEVSQRGDIVRYNKLVESEPALTAAALKIQLQYEELLAAELSREAGCRPEEDLYAKLLAGFLVNGNFTVARMALASNRLRHYASMALQMVDFAIHEFPSRAEFEKLRRARPVRRQSA
jgi:AcrR family transcriptional regulator